MRQAGIDWNDRAQALVAVSWDGPFLRHAAPAFKADKEIVMAAVIQSGFALTQADNALKEDQDFMSTALQVIAQAKFKNPQYIVPKPYFVDVGARLEVIKARHQATIRVMCMMLHYMRAEKAFHRMDCSRFVRIIFQGYLTPFSCKPNENLPAETQHVAATAASALFSSEAKVPASDASLSSSYP